MSFYSGPSDWQEGVSRALQDPHVEVSESWDRGQVWGMGVVGGLFLSSPLCCFFSFSQSFTMKGSTSHDDFKLKVSIPEAGH